MTSVMLSPKPPVRQADTDGQLIGLWLHGRSEHTQRAYRADVAALLAFVARPLPALTLGDLQAWADSLTGSAATRHRRLSAVKSLLAFGHRLGYLPFDVGRALRLPKVRDRLAERILAEEAVLRMIHMTQRLRDHVLVRLLYAAGVRVSELHGLRWRDVQATAAAGQITVYGKGGKTRSVPLTPATWAKLAALRAEAELGGGDGDGGGGGGPVFRSRRGGPLSVPQMWRIVRQAAQRAGLDRPVSPHWLRHAHASHALDKGTPATEVRDTLGHASIAVTDRYSHARPASSSGMRLSV